MGAALILISILVFGAIFIYVGCIVVRRLLPVDHFLQSYLDDDVMEVALAYLFKNYKFISGFLLISYFTLVTIIYS